MSMDRKQKILIVDDKPENLLSLESILESPNLDIVKSLSGNDALWQVLRHDFALIIMDVQMPGMDGFETTIHIRSLNRGKHVPIIYVTAISKEQKYIFKGYETGAVDYLFKPIEPEILKSKVNVFLELDRQKTLVEEKSLMLEELTLIDPLTELYNRRGLQRFLSDGIRQIIRQDGRDILALLIDIDNFKQINDSLGHAVGDVVLKDIASNLKGSLRPLDYLARIGGDEFMILLMHINLAEGLKVAERIRLAVSNTNITLPTGMIKITASLGLIKVSSETPSIDELLSELHSVLKCSKQEGKNRVSSKWMPSRPRKGESPSHRDILEAIRSGDYFQQVILPIIGLQDENETGYEILSRLYMSGMEDPNVFFSFCLKNNILTLADHMCFKKCLDATIGLPSGTRYHINIFPSTLIDVPVQHLLEDFPDNIPRSVYCVEISEQQIIGDPSYLIEPVFALRKAGVLIAVDDVGFGHSCFESLILLQPDIIKIDKRCVAGIAQNSLKIQAMERILNIGKVLGCQVVAEGIESRDVLETLKQLGVQYGQGFLWGKPKPISKREVLPMETAEADKSKHPLCP